MSNISYRPGRMGRYLLSSVLVATITTCSFTGARAQVLSLDTVLRLIDAQNPMLREYDNNVRALDAYSSGARSWMAPMVGAGTFMTPYPNQMLMEEGDKGAWMFTVEQEIPNPSKQRANEDYLRSKGEVEEQERAVQYNRLRAEAKAWYYRWLVAEEKLETLKENERIMDLMLKLARIRYPYNQGSLGNIYKAEGRLSEVRNMILMTQADISEAAFRIKSLANIPSSDSVMIDTTTVVQFDIGQVVYDTMTLSQQRSDVRKIEESIQVMRLNQRLQRFQVRPDFRIRFDHMQPIGNMPTQFSAMAMVSIPIAPWSSRMYRSEVKGMEYEIEAMKNGREALLIETRGMLAGMTARIKSMQEQIDNYRMRIIPALRKNYQTLMLAYEENKEQLPMVIDGWETLNMAQMDYLNQLQEYYLMIVSYEKELER